MSLYYGREVKKVIDSVIADEISEIVLLGEDDAETKLTIIKGIYVLAAALDEVFNVKDEEEE